MERYGIIWFRYVGEMYVFRLEPDDCPCGRDYCVFTPGHIDQPDQCPYFESLEKQWRDHKYSFSATGKFICNY